MVDDILLLTRNPPPTSYERKVDPILLEALLMNYRVDTVGGTSTPQCAVSHHPLTEEIHSLVLLRSEAERNN
jgi:hypothetical protein